MLLLSEPLFLGKISYLNVLPIYYPLEAGFINHPFQMVSGPPSKLNRLMQQGELDISAASSIEYARNFNQYYLVPDLAIGSQGPVQSVLLLSRLPFEQLQGKSILISSQTHTSASLLRMLLQHHFKLSVDYTSGNIMKRIQTNDFPDAYLAIGDEALRLREHPAFPYHLDLGQAWMNWTGLPFIFGVWVINKKSAAQRKEQMTKGCRSLLSAKAWGLNRVDFFAEMIADQGILNKEKLLSYFKGLVYDLGVREKKGLQSFYEHLYEAGEIEALPHLEFYH